MKKINMSKYLYKASGFTMWFIVLVIAALHQVTGQLLDNEFQPTVTATCKDGYMTIRLNLNDSFVGALHARDYRTSQCMVAGNGSKQATLGINLLAVHGAPDYCGVIINNSTEERSLPIAVRIHKTLELADDKFYVITCGKAGFKNAKNETSLVSLRLLDSGRRVQEAIYGHNYTLRMYGIRVKSCFAFNKRNSSVQLIDDRGCPVKNHVITKFIYDTNTGIADATLYSMFRFPESPQVHFQCDIAVCRGEEGILLAGTSVFVLNPGETPVVQTLYDDGAVHPQWLLWLAVAFGILFLIMLIINILLCSAMTCSCARTEIIEKEPSIIEDYDPYRSWPGSQYGSRYSLNGKPGGYPSGGSTMNSTRSISTNSDHYAIVQSRPGSRYSGPGHKHHHHHHHRGPPSNIGSHYSLAPLRSEILGYY
ncbi:Protein of unknown function [Cotesia congregata]|uniref:ZP domain-containing protein n=1 Tax=Cotesia congregata TaxID=51543 RepID=A0A8J2H8V9_COTCN|nr:Protein of unknown function [Cotesia congregata]